MPNTFKLAGHVFDNTGAAVGATVQRYEVATTTTFGSSTTASGSTGKWAFTDGENGYDVKITYGSNVRWLKGLDELQVSELAIIQSTEGGVANFYIASDQADDAGDSWRMQAGTSNTLAFANNRNATNTFVDQLTLTNDATPASTVLTLTGQLVATSLDINGAADISGDLTLSGGGDGALVFGTAGENSIKIPDNQASALIIEEANNAYITFVTTNSSEAITVAKATTFSAGIANSGTIAAGTWNGTAIGSSYIAADAITGAKIADNAIDSEHYTDGSIDADHIASSAVTTAKINADAITAAKIADNAIGNEHLADDVVDSDEIAAGAIDTAHIADNQVTVAKLVDLSRGSIIVGNASAASAALAVGSANQVLKTDGSDITWGSITVLGTVGTGVWNGTAIDGGYINDNIISGQAEIASGLAAADELLYSDAGTVKRVGLDTLTTYLAGVNAGTVTSTGISDSSGVLTLDIQNMTASTTADDADLIVIDDGPGGNLRKQTRAHFLSGVGGGITQASTWLMTSDFDPSSDGTITANLSEKSSAAGRWGKIGSSMTESSGIFTFPATGIWMVTWGISIYGSGNDTVCLFTIQTSNDGFSSDSNDTGRILLAKSANEELSGYASIIMDVTNTSNDQVRFRQENVAANITIAGAVNNNTWFEFVRLGDT